MALVVRGSPSSMATMRQGAQDANAFLDVESIYELRAQNERGKISFYGGSDQLANFTTLAHEPMFVTNDRRHDDDERLYVNSALNGYGSDASEAVKRVTGITEADRLELIRQSVKAGITFAGVAVAGCNVNDASIGCAVSVSGLETVVIGNGHCGTEYVDPRISPGQALVWDVPNPGSTGLYPPKGGYHPEELFRTKYRLQLRPRSEASLASTLLFHSRMVATVPATWTRVMGGKNPSAKAWDTATRDFSRMLKTAASLVLYQLLKSGTVQHANPLPGSTIESQAAGIAATIGAFEHETNDAIVAQEIDRMLFVNSTSIDVTKLSGDSLPLIRSYLVGNGDTKPKRSGTIEEKLVDAQLNAFRRGITAILTAHLEDDRFNAGVALTGADGVSQMHVNIAQGIRR